MTSDWYEDNTIFISVTENLSFFPSVVDFSSRPSDKTVHYKSDDFSQLQSFIHYVQNTFDVILYDCQAGYTEVLPSLLPQVDVALFVLEADSISASAMRSLHLKIGNHLHAAHLYQVFNKATPEEFETYSKIVGTFFTNIGTFLFDWKIRQAFSRSQIPDLENTSASFGIDLCNICKVMIPERVLNEKLDSFSSHLKLQQLEEKKGQLEDKLKHLSSKTRLSSRILFPIALSMISLIAVLAIPTSIDLFKSISAETLYNTLTVVVFLILFLVSVPYTLRSTLQEDRKERLEYERELNNLEKSIKN